MNKNVIEIKNLCKVYKLYEKPIDRLKESLHFKKKKMHREHYALKNLSIEIKNGETIGIIGTNGSGKSTLLKIITGVLNQTSGEVKVNGKVSALLELGAGFNPEYSGRENIYLNGAIMGYTESEVSEKLDSIIEFANIGAFIEQPVKTYSSGMFARLAFSVAVNIEPDILIVDEALAVGDSRFQQKSIRKMKDLIKKAKAILFVSHDTTSIRELCSKTLWIKDGEVFAFGDTRRITRMYDDFVSHGVFTDVKSEKEVKVKEEKKTRENNDNQLYVLEKINKTNASGGEKAEFISFGLFDKKTFSRISVVEAEEKVFSEVVLNVKDDIKEPLLGIGIFNEKGVPILHFNNYSIKKRFDVFNAGSEIRVRFDFTIPNLRNGDYFISIGLDEGEYGEHKIVERINECYKFKVQRDDLYSKQHGQLIFENVGMELVEERCGK